MMDRLTTDPSFLQAAVWIGVAAAVLSFVVLAVALSLHRRARPARHGIERQGIERQGIEGRGVEGRTADPIRDAPAGGGKEAASVRRRPESTG